MKKALSLILALALVICSLTTLAFAQQEKPYYVVLGDSIAYGSGLSNPTTACYGRVIADTMDYDYVNHAIPGHTTQRLIGRLGEEKVIEDVRKADIISISIGGNDFLMNNLTAILYGYIVKGDTTMIEDIEKSFYDNFSEIMDIIRANNEDALVLMQTIYNPQFNSLKEAYKAGGDAINRAVVRYSEENPGDIVIVDVASVLNGDEGNFAADGIHPSVKGNELIAGKIAEALIQQGVADTADLVITQEGKDIRISPIFAFNMEFTGRIFKLLSNIRSFLLKIF